MISKSKILTWVIVALVVLNLATIASIFYHNYKEKKLSEESIEVEGQVVNGAYIRDHVGFNGNQIGAFREANRNFRPHARSVIYRIDSLKNEMFSELQKQGSDTVKLAAIATRIGDLHGELKRGTFEYYLTLKAISTPEQLPRLEKMFTPLFSNENMNVGPGWQGGGPGKGRGRRWGQQNQIDKNLK